MDFACSQCSDKSFTTLRGWKQHMSRAHGGFDESDIAKVTSGTNSGEDDVASRMHTFVNSLPPEAGGGGEVQDESASGQVEVPQTPPPLPPVKTIKATPKRLKKILAAIPTKMLEGAGIELDDEDKEALEEAGEFLTDIFGVEFEINQQKQVLKSRLWAVGWVFGVAALIYVKHRFKDVWMKLYESYKKAAAEKAEKERDV